MAKEGPVSVCVRAFLLNVTLEECDTQWRAGLTIIDTHPNTPDGYH